MSSSGIVCRYYLLGTCRFGDHCRYSHGPGRSHNGNPSTTAAAATTVVPLPTRTDECITSSSSSSNSNKNSSTTTTSIPSKTGTTIKQSWLDAPEFVPKAVIGASGSAGTSHNQHRGRRVKAKKASRAFVREMDDVHYRVTDDEEDDEDDDDDEEADTEDDDNINVITSYADLFKPEAGEGGATADPHLAANPSAVPSTDLCPFLMRSLDGVCPYGEVCMYVHGLACDMCGQYCMHPTDEGSRKEHTKQCMEQHEKDMELSFAIARSKDKSCGICFEIVIEKPGSDQRFGILQNCNHVYCLECIRKWRQNQGKQFNSQIARSCPECRITSDFICPSTYWVGDMREEKDKLITAYKTALGDKHCKYFKNGDGKCPFGNHCFYKHVDKHNQKVDVGAPRKAPRRYDCNGDLMGWLDDHDTLDSVMWLDGALRLPIGFTDFLIDNMDDFDDDDFDDDDDDDDDEDSIESLDEELIRLLSLTTS